MYEIADMNSQRFVDIISPGARTCVQDLGRDGWRHLGVARAGALDPAQAMLANRLLGNPGQAAVLEITMSGPALVFAHPSRIALCGAHFDSRFEDTSGSLHAMPSARPVRLPAGTLRLGTARKGLRAWLAIEGGVEVPQVLGSRSTDLRGGFGGYEGRTLRAGDRLALGAPSCDAHTDDALADPLHPQAPAWWISLDDIGMHDVPIRYVPSSLCIAASLANRNWRVDPRSDRQGLRCEGDAIPTDLPEEVSAPVAPGTIQLPPDGHPIVLLADAQTVGGYPRLGYVIATDLPRLAQLRPGDPLRFTAVDRAEAQSAVRRRQGDIARLHWAIERALQHAPVTRPET
jgi:5-oxoprolinase (ATP-hydrolysing) subunit C